MNGYQAIEFMIFIAVAGTCGLYSFSLHTNMVDQVNAKLPANFQFSELWWDHFKSRRLLSEYRRLYPSGNLDKRLCFVAVVMLSMLLVVAWQIRFPPQFILLFGILGTFVVWLGYRRN